MQQNCNKNRVALMLVGRGSKRKKTDAKKRGRFVAAADTPPTPITGIAEAVGKAANTTKAERKRRLQRLKHQRRHEAVMERKAQGDPWVDAFANAASDVKKNFGDSVGEDAVKRSYIKWQKILKSEKATPV